MSNLLLRNGYIEARRLVFYLFHMRRKPPRTILLPWEEQIVGIGEDDDVSAINTQKVTYALLIIVLLKNLGDLLTLAVQVLRNIF